MMKNKIIELILRVVYFIFIYCGIICIYKFIFVEFCIEFFSELKNREIRKANFLLEVIILDYVICGTLIRDLRLREVIVNVSFSCF